MGGTAPSNPTGSTLGRDVARAPEQIETDLELTPRFPGFCPQVGRWPGQGKVIQPTAEFRQVVFPSLMLTFFVKRGQEGGNSSSNKTYQALGPCRAPKKCQGLSLATLSSQPVALESSLLAKWGGYYVSDL